MPIPLIVVVDLKAGFQNEVRKWAHEGKADHLSDGDLDILLTPSFANVCKVDRSFPATPVGKVGAIIEPDATAISHSDYQIDISEIFALRAWSKADKYADLDAIPFQNQGRYAFADPQIASFALPTGFRDGPVGDSAKVQAQLRAQMLHSQGLDGREVAIAIMDGGINRDYLESKLGAGKVSFDVENSWTPRGGRAPFDYLADHGTMCAFDALLAAPSATLLDYPIRYKLPPANGEGGTVKSLLSGALPGFVHLALFWAKNLLFAKKYRALVSSNSWGVSEEDDFKQGHGGRYIDNPRHPFNRLVSALTLFGVDVVFAAGNSGQASPPQPIMGANALRDVLTVAGCDTNDCLVDYSSRGPGIDGMFKRKPDVTAYTHFDGSRAFRPSGIDKGTSASCPVAAGCVAALRTRDPAGNRPRPGQLIEIIQQSARQLGPKPWNEEFGFGIIDPVAAAQSLGIYSAASPSNTPTQTTDITPISATDGTSAETVAEISTPQS